MADQRQEVARALGEALATTEASHCIDLGPVGELIHGRFDDICKGNRFDFGPVHALLVSMEGVTEAGIYVGVVRFKSVLAGMGLTLTEPIGRSIHHTGTPSEARQIPTLVTASAP